MWRALNDYRQAKPVKAGNKKKEADFPDALIVNKAKFHTMEKGKRSTGFILLDLPLIGWVEYDCRYYEGSHRLISIF